MLFILIQLSSWSILILTAVVFPIDCSVSDSFIFIFCNFHFLSPISWGLSLIISWNYSAGGDYDSDGKIDELKLLYRTYITESLSSGRLEENKVHQWFFFSCNCCNQKVPPNISHIHNQSTAFGSILLSKISLPFCFIFIVSFRCLVNL